MESKTWDSYFLPICEAVSSKSPCLSRKVGAVLVRDKVIIATGFNGPPRGIPHCGPERNKSDITLFHRINNNAHEPVFGDDTMCPRQRLGYGSGQGLELCPAAHAEDNCISNAARVGTTVAGATLYMSCGIPCKDCLKKIINVGITEIVCQSNEVYDDLTAWMLRVSKVNVRIIEEV